MQGDGLVGLVFNRESSSSGMTDDSNHSNRILLESLIRIANGSNDVMLEVYHSTDIVDDGKICNIIEKSIDGDVPAQGVLFWCPKALFPDEFSFFCLYFFKFRSAPESGYFDDLTSLEEYMDQSEPTANDATIFKESIDLMGVRIRDDIEVFWNLSEEKIPNTSSDEISQKPVSVETVKDF
jgi:hypothetical protein